MLLRHKALTNEIMAELNRIASEFSVFQNENGLPCPSGCGKCCFKSDIFCTPIELLPMAMDLLERGEAMQVYEKCKTFSDARCMFMEIENRSDGRGKCVEYQFRPLVCRIFGVAARHDKNGEINFSVCSNLKENYPEQFENLEKKYFDKQKVPFVELAKGQLASLDPRFLEREYPINEALSMILEKVLMDASFMV